MISWKILGVNTESFPCEEVKLEVVVLRKVEVVEVPAQLRSLATGDARAVQSGAVTGTARDGLGGLQDLAQD